MKFTKESRTDKRRRRSSSKVELPELRAVAFIDILGFREIINRMFSSEPRLYEIVKDMLFRLKGFERNDNSTGLIATAFSDSIVMSSPSVEGFQELLISAQHLVEKLLRQGIFCRGGIASGRTFHFENIVFGEGLIRAYDLERKYASVPRVVIANELIPSMPEILGGVGMYPWKRDTDNQLFINPFATLWKPSPSKIDSISDALNSYLDGAPDIEAFSYVREEIIKLARKSHRQTNPKLRASLKNKVSWLSKQFNETITEHLPKKVRLLPHHANGTQQAKHRSSISQSNRL